MDWTVLLALTVWAAWRAPIWGFAAIWFWVTLIPSVGVDLLPVPTAVMAERFLYLPSVGFCLLLGMGSAPAGLRRALAADQLRPVPALGLATPSARLPSC